PGAAPIVVREAKPGGWSYALGELFLGVGHELVPAPQEHGGVLGEVGADGGQLDEARLDHLDDVGAIARGVAEELGADHDLGRGDRQPLGQEGRAYGDLKKGATHVDGQVVDANPAKDGRQLHAGDERAAALFVPRFVPEEDVHVFRRAWPAVNADGERAD